MSPLLLRLGLCAGLAAAVASATAAGGGQAAAPAAARTAPPAAASFDYVIVGAGTAGSVLANRLTEHPGMNVLLLEAGGPDDDPRVHQPSAFRELAGSALDWRYETEPEPGLGGRRVPWPRGKVWGGSGSLTAMVYLRGHRSDFDRWRDLGNEGWGYQDLLPYFRKAQNQERGPSREHGTGGPQNVADPRWLPPIALAFVEAAVELGFARNGDFNAGSQAGVGLFQLNQRNGERHSTADAYLRPVLHRANLTLLSHARAIGVLVEGGRAHGVRYLRDGVLQEARASREVLLAAGAVGSPQLLLLSGVGPGGQLRAVGVEPRHELPGVGVGLQDHPRVALAYESLRPLGFTGEAERERALAAYRLNRGGPLAGNGVGAGLFVAAPTSGGAGEGSAAPEIEIVLTPDPARGVFSLQTVLLQPTSRGSVRLRSADPQAPPAILVNYLSQDGELDALARGLRLARRLAGTAALAPYRGRALADPGDDSEALRRYARDNATTFYHAAGSCRMGRDPLAVVDAQLRVRGLAGLRVIDASVMPVLVTGATHAATVMIAEKGADLVKRTW